MKRTFAALVATIAGLVVLLGFKTHSARLPAQPPLGAAASSPPVPQTSSPPAPATSTSPSTTTPSAAAHSAQTQTRTITGSSIGTRYGDVEVQVTFAGTQITNVVPVRLPDSNGVDQEIDQQAVPILIQETLTAQNANIQAVSGATYTSDGYIRSLQSALDKAKGA
ncbi:MAG TPA: FMN-binding protein [Acidothermaceae bacterium]|jgi:uncharacterized protein with FMN-binding domain|nr:FMN-binding protein [Acidothermaceae bacterium]